LKVGRIPFSLHISANYKGSFLFNLEIGQPFYNRVNTPRENLLEENIRCTENVPTRRYIDRKTFNSYYVRFFVSKVWFILLYQSKYGYNINEITPWCISVILLPSLKVKRVMEYHSAA